MAQQKIKHASHTKSCQLARQMQAPRRRARLERTLKELRRKLAKTQRQGRSTAGIQKTIEQVEYALTYDRPQGKKGPEGVPKDFAPPHSK